MTQAPPPPPAPSSHPPPPAGGHSAPVSGQGGMPKWVWFAGGCLVLLLLGVGACVVGGVILGKKAADTARDFSENPAKAAELIVRMNPDLEVVKTDKGEGTITIREKSTGKVSTFDWTEIKQGRIRFENEDGESSIDFSGEGEEGTVTVETPEGKTRIGGGGLEDVPGWVVLHPDGSTAQATMTSSGTKGQSGLLSQKISGANRTEVMDWYKEALEAAGWEVETTKMDISGQGAYGTVTGQRTDPKRTLSITVTEQEGGGVQTMVTYEGKG